MFENLSEHDGPITALDINSDGLSVLAATQTVSIYQSY